MATVLSLFRTDPWFTIGEFFASGAQKRPRGRPPKPPKLRGTAGVLPGYCRGTPRCLVLYRHFTRTLGFLRGFWRLCAFGEFDACVCFRGSLLLQPRMLRRTTTPGLATIRNVRLRGRIAVIPTSEVIRSDTLQAQGCWTYLRGAAVGGGEPSSSRSSNSSSSSS